MKKALISVILFLFLIMPLHVIAFESSWEGKDYYTHTGTTADNVTFAWDGSLGPSEEYEVEIYNPERNITKHMGYTTQNEITFKVPRTGHWIGRLRVRSLKQDGTYDYGDWVESIDPNVAIVNIDVCDENGCTLTPTNRAWWCFAWIKSTGPIITNSGNFTGIIRRESQ